MGFQTTTFLYATPSPWREAGRVLDLSGMFDDYNRSSDPDSVALRMDFKAVGGDLWRAFAGVLQTHK